MAEFKEGQIIEVRYPFVRDVFTEHEDDGEGGFTSHDIPCWKPGIRHELVAPYNEEFEELADGEGQMILTIISLHKPGKYPERVFFIRQWRDPDGKVFGNTRLHMTTVQAFTRRASRYLHDYILEGQAEAAE